MYNDIAALDAGAGDNLGGICSFRFVPREWLAGRWEANLATGAVTTLPALISGKSWMTAACMDDTMMYEEKAKTDKGGSYMEATLSGVAYRHELARHVAIGALQYHELVVIYLDANGVSRIVGNADKAMSFAADNTTGKAAQDAELYMISLTQQLAEPAPIYTGI